MTPAELFYLLFGSSIGFVAGAFAHHLVRTRAAPEIRLTITRNALPVRVVQPDPPGEPMTLRRNALTRRPRERVAVPVSGGRDPALAALGLDATETVATAAVSRDVAHARQAAAPRSGVRPLAAARAGAVAVLARPTAMAPANESARASSAAGAASGAGATPDPCAGPRQLAAERCLVASQAREHAERAAVEARGARRAYDQAVQAAEEAARTADPRVVTARKEAARLAFREATAAARDRRAQETAATIWLTEINGINRARRDALAVAAAVGRRMADLLPQIERLALAADAARITAETAAATCNEARGTLAACEEVLVGGGATAALARVTADRPEEPADRSGGAGSDEDRVNEDLARLRAAGRQPAIDRLLAGDGATLARLVDAAAGTPDERRQLQLALSSLVDAIVAAAIEQAFLEFPDGHPFWGELGRAERRQVAVGLAGLGCRFDGLGGFEDARVPSTRDLSLAVGYAGLDPRRLRHWPSAAEAHDLYRDVVVAAGEFLASTAPDLALSELVGMLGRRSETLADLWNQWGRVRPLLLATIG